MLLGSITSRSSGKEPAVLHSRGGDRRHARAAEIEPRMLWVLRRQFLSKMFTKLIVIFFFFFFFFYFQLKYQERNFKLVTFSCRETGLPWEAKLNRKENIEKCPSLFTRAPNFSLAVFFRVTLDGLSERGATRGLVFTLRSRLSGIKIVTTGSIKIAIVYRRSIFQVEGLKTTWI